MIFELWAHVPRTSLARPSQVPRRSHASSGPSIDGEASQIARNVTYLCIQYGRPPFFGKVPSDEFLMQRYWGACPFSRAGLLSPPCFNRRNRLGCCFASAIYYRACDIRDFCTRQGGSSFLHFAPKTFFSSFTLGYARSQSTWPN